MPALGLTHLLKIIEIQKWSASDMKAIKISDKIAAIFVSSAVLFSGLPANSATFLYVGGTSETRYTEGSTTFNGITYDGVFETTFFSPISMSVLELSGFFSIVGGMLGEAVSIRAVQQSPEDRTGIGDAGVTQTDYSDTLQDVASLSEPFLTIPPGLTEFDFKFVPGPIANAPTVVSKGWTVTLVPEPSSAIALAFLGGGLLATNKRRRSN
ncbi:MAG: PEP-CTERM sorting domain-containing protein [Cyanobacteriota bacterium]|nr:PEP-CTERM sorting domain-containing protein [Cyanobacteriota bacterium]